MSTDYYVVHDGRGTLMRLEECKIVAVKEDNEEAREAVENDDTSYLLETANKVYSESEITLG